MKNDAIRALMAEGLAAMKAGGSLAAEATREIRKDVSHPDLAVALEEGHRMTQRWAERIDQTLGEVGGGEARRNPIIEAHYEVGRRVREGAPDDASRDLGIIANGQLALHYWIAAFGTMRAYAEHLGLRETANAMRSSLEEAERMDETNTRNAETIMGG